MAIVPTRSHWLACVLSMALAPTGPWLEAQQPAAPATQQAPAVAAQPQAEAPRATYERGEGEENRHAELTRADLRRLLERHPPNLVAVLQLDPALLSDQAYLAPYPELRAFLASHPEVSRNPSFFVGNPDQLERDADPRAMAFRAWDRAFEMVSMTTIFVTLMGVLVWIVRTLLDYRRWLRLSRVQAEAHAKLLDRLTQNDELLAYVQSPAGSAFLASAPIPLDAGPRSVAAPFSRILWSVQAGVVLAFGGVGLLWASGRVVPEMAPPLSVLGILALMVGAGFVASAFFAHVLARRLGLLDTGAASSLAVPRADQVS
jgi:hypothetical protein